MIRLGRPAVSYRWATAEPWPLLLTPAIAAPCRWPGRSPWGRCRDLVTTATDALGQPESAVYDRRNRKTSTTDHIGSLSGLITATTDRNGVPTTLAYDAAGRVVRSIRPTDHPFRCPPVT